LACSPTMVAPWHGRPFYIPMRNRLDVILTSDEKK
jgi:hypothetical protein